MLFALLLAAAAGSFARWPLACLTALTRAQLALAGVHSRLRLLDGVQTHYLEGGRGQPVVLVHGLGGQALDWAPLLQDLVRAGYHVYALDLPGFGRSDRPADRTYSVREQAAFVESFLRALGLQQVALVGISMGGWISATVALEEPLRVERLVLLDSAGFPFKLSFDPELFAPRTPAQVDALLALLMPRPEPIPAFLKEDVVRHVSERRWVIERALVSMRDGADLLDQRLSALKQPLLLIWGKQDAMTPLSLGEAMHRAVPGSVLEVYDGCGHIAAMTCVERIRPRLVDFMAGKGPQAGATVEVPQR